MSEDVTSLGSEKFVSLTTFRRNGEGVATALWVVPDGDELAVWTPSGSWKVTRVRRDPRVTLVPCGRRGAVSDGAVPVEGTAVVVEDPQVVSRTEAALKRKYGLEFRIVTLIEKLIARGRPAPRVVLQISLSGQQASDGQRSGDQ